MTHLGLAAAPIGQSQCMKAKTRERWRLITFLVWVVTASGWSIDALAAERWGLAAFWIALLAANLVVWVWDRRRNETVVFPPERS